MIKKFPRILGKIASAFVCAILIAQPSFAILPDDDELDYLDRNNIYYYNPVGMQCGVGSTQLVGDTDIEKIWNFYINKGYNDAQVAGILGNGITESGTSPTRSTTGAYFGLFQWGGARRDALFQRIRDAGLGQYLSSEYWGAGADQKIPPADRDRLIEIELEHSFDENDTKWQTELKTAKTPEEAAEIFLVHFERAIYVPAYASACQPIEYYAPYKGVLYQGTKSRRENARQLYEEYAGKGVSSTTGGSAHDENGENLTIIGDSITVGAKTAFFDIFPSLAESSFDARVSRPWKEGVELAKTMQGKKQIVVFALGTNSPNLTQYDLEEAVAAIGSDKIIVLVTNYVVGANTYDANNELFKNFAKSNGNVILADWEAAVKSNPQKYIADNYVHPNQEGSKLFVETIKEAISGNVSADRCHNTVGDQFTDLVKAYAWPEYHHAPFTDRMPAYVDAVNQSVAEGRYVGGFAGVDCGGFVTVLVQNSGLEPDYNKTAPGPGTTVNQKAWVKEHGWTLLNANESTPVDASILQAGDVAFSPGHTFIYVGEIDGFGSKIASASYGERAPMAGFEDTQTGNGGIVTWWRNPNIDMQKLTTTSTLATGGSSDSGSSSAGSVTETSGEAGLKSGNYDGWNYYMYTPEKSNGSLVVFLHGSGEIGTNVEKLKNDGGFAAHIANGSNYNSYVLMPQLPSGNWLEGDNPTQKLRALIDKTVAENNIDRSRIHIVGFSMGANQLPDVVENNPGLFASATIITNAWYGRTNELKRMPVRIYYGRDDTANNGGAQPLYNELHNAGSQVEIYSYPNQWHANTVGRVLDDQETNFMDWIMRQQRD